MLNAKLLAQLSPLYDLGEIIGSGSYGAVFSGVSKVTQEQVAIKVFLTGQKLSANCLNEIKLIFRLDHPHVVRPLDFFFVSNCYAIVFEFMNQGDLRRMMQDQPLSESHTLMIGLQLATGLAYVHSKGIIHRDLKPENILIHQTEKEILYKIGDFNISRFSRKGYLTASNQGSPLYMAPEQFYDRYDHRADLYALGVILYELLAGKPPFEGIYQALMRDHIHQEPDWSPVKVSELTLGILKDLLQKSPDQRPEHALALARRLNLALQQTLPEASPRTLDRLATREISEEPVLTWDEDQGAFYLKYLDTSLWKECYSATSLPELSKLVAKDYLSL